MVSLIEVDSYDEAIYKMNKSPIIGFLARFFKLFHQKLDPLRCGQKEVLIRLDWPGGPWVGKVGY